MRRLWLMRRMVAVRLNEAVLRRLWLALLMLTVRRNAEMTRRRRRAAMTSRLRLAARRVRPLHVFLLLSRELCRGRISPPPIPRRSRRWTKLAGRLWGERDRLLGKLRTPLSEPR
jgi:hypothetical protein